VFIGPTGAADYIAFGIWYLDAADPGWVLIVGAAEQIDCPVFEDAAFKLGFGLSDSGRFFKNLAQSLTPLFRYRTARNYKPGGRKGKIRL